MKVKWILSTLVLLIYACGGGETPDNGGTDLWPDPPTYSEPEGTITSSTNLVVGGQTYTISWNTQNTGLVRLELTNLTSSSLVGLGRSDTLDPPIPDPVLISTEKSGILTATATAGVTKAYRLIFCNPDATECRSSHVIVWEEQSILEAFAPNRIRWSPGALVTVCVKTTEQNVLNAVHSAINDTNQILGQELTLTLSQDPNACGTVITTNYITVEIGPLPPNVGGGTTVRIDYSTYYITGAEITINEDIVQIDTTGNNTTSIVYHEFAHALGFETHVNENLNGRFGSFLMAGDIVTGYDELVVLVLQLLYGLR